MSSRIDLKRFLVSLMQSNNFCNLTVGISDFFPEQLSGVAIVQCNRTRLSILLVVLDCHLSITQLQYVEEENATSVPANFIFAVCKAHRFLTRLWWGVKLQYVARIEACIWRIRGFGFCARRCAVPSTGRARGPDWLQGERRPDADYQIAPRPLAL